MGVGIQLLVVKSTSRSAKEDLKTDQIAISDSKLITTHVLVLAGKQNIYQVVALGIVQLEVHCTYFFCTSSLPSLKPLKSRIISHNFFFCKQAIPHTCAYTHAKKKKILSKRKISLQYFI